MIFPLYLCKNQKCFDCLNLIFYTFLKAKTNIKEITFSIVIIITIITFIPLFLLGIQVAITISYHLYVFFLILSGKNITI